MDVDLTHVRLSHTLHPAPFPACPPPFFPQWPKLCTVSKLPTLTVAVPDGAVVEDIDFLVRIQRASFSSLDFDGTS